MKEILIGIIAAAATIATAVIGACGPLGLCNNDGTTPSPPPQPQTIPPQEFCHDHDGSSEWHCHYQ